MWANEHHEEIERLICSKCDADKNRDYSPCKDCKRRDDFELGYATANERNGWHSIRDELPEKEKYVLVYTNIDNVYKARLVKDEYFITNKGGFVQTSAIVAWKETDFPEGD